MILVASGLLIIGFITLVGTAVVMAVMAVAALAGVLRPSVYREGGTK